MVERKQKLDGSTDGENPAPPSAPKPVSRRRLISNPANDNVPTPLGRAARAGILVAIGAVLAWVLHVLFG